MPVIVPSAPDGSEGIRLHEDAGSVSTFAYIMLCTTEVRKHQEYHSLYKLPCLCTFLVFFFLQLNHVHQSFLLLLNMLVLIIITEIKL